MSKNTQELNKEILESVVAEITESRNKYVGSSSDYIDLIDVVNAKIVNCINEIYNATCELNTSDSQSRENLKKLIMKNRCYEAIRTSLVDNNKQLDKQLFKR